MKRMIRVASVWMMVFIAVQAGSAPGPDPQESLRYIDAEIAFKSEMAACLYERWLENREYDALHYSIHLIPDFELETMSGEVDMLVASTADNLNVISLDMGSRIEATGVTSNGLPLDYIHEENVLTITLDHEYAIDETFMVTVMYAGKPPKWTFNFSTHNSVPLFSTMSEPEGGREWWPSNDVPWDKATTDLSATVPDWMFVASNGLLTDDIDHGDGTHTVTWVNSHPIATYLVSAAGTDYETILYHYTPLDPEEPPMPVPVYVYPELRQLAEKAFEDTVDMIEFFALNIGEYPFLNEKYGQVLVAVGGGMEHQTITHINADYIRNGGKPNSLIAHELAHMWWGDYITMSEWPHIWLNESFATYSDALYQEYRYGPEHLKSLMRSYRNRDYTGSIYDPVYLFDAIVYTKGAFVLHMLRGITGDENFWTILQTYYDDQRFAYGNASTDDFRSICESVHGENLGWFFDQWIYGVKRPTIRYGWDYAPMTDGPEGSPGMASGYRTTVTLEQIQEDLPLFRFPVDIQLETAEETVTETFWMDDKTLAVVFDTVQPPLAVTLDPDVWLLAWMEYDPAQFQFSSPAKLPAARFGSHYTETLELMNGTPPFTIEIIDGTLPAGIVLDGETGSFSGFPLEKGTFNFTVHAWDSREQPRHTIAEFQLKTLYPMAEIAVVPDNDVYTGGDTMVVGLSLQNRLETPLDTTLFIALEIEGAFYFLDVTQGVFPAFSTVMASIPLQMPPEFSVDFDLLVLPLPDPLPALSGAWWGLLLDDESGTAAGPFSLESFQFE